MNLISDVDLRHSVIHHVAEDRYNEKTYKNQGKSCHKLFHPQLGVKTLLDGGRRRTKNLYGVVKRTVPAGQVRQ